MVRVFSIINSALASTHHTSFVLYFSTETPPHPTTATVRPHGPRLPRCVLPPYLNHDKVDPDGCDDQNGSTPIPVTKYVRVLNFSNFMERPCLPNLRHARGREVDQKLQLWNKRKGSGPNEVPQNGELVREKCAGGRRNSQLDLLIFFFFFTRGRGSKLTILSRTSAS